ncbi:MAG: (Fe-S)-binding protein [Dehalococcoidales bacterium]|jgi:Fe-S oxidoreductase|nr:(Fe-S)-binding protein [Dehalococcoidales bacterium]
MSPVSATYWGISGYVIFWVLFAVAIGLFSRRAYFLVRVMLLGQKENRFDRLGYRIRSTLFETVLQWCSLKNVNRSGRDLAGIGHAFLFWGFSSLLIGYILFIGLSGGLGLWDMIMGSTFEIVYSSILDLAALLVATSVIWAAIRRYVIKPKRLQGETSAEAGIILMVVFSLMVLHVSIEGFGYAAYDISESWPPLGAALAGFLNSTGLSQGALVAGYQGVWWLHYIMIIGFLVFIPRSKHLHLLASFPNVAFRKLTAKGSLEPIDLEQAETFGVPNIQDFTWKDLLDLYSCTVCGQCQDQCPANSSGKQLSPKKVIHDLKDHLMEVGPELLKVAGGAEASPDSPGKTMAGKVITEDEIWACTTCRACVEVCPLHIEHIDKIIGMRRSLVMERSEMPDEVQQALQCLTSREHPWRGTTATRTDWTEGLEIKALSEDSDVDILFWVGCTSALEDRNMKVASATARILKEAGVKFGILGAEESCCGDPARRLGDEYLFQTLCEKNIETLNSYNVKKILTTCPHCFNTLKNEYPQFSGNFEVIHHTQFLLDLISEGKVKIGNLESSKVVAYHDSCYLGRYNGIYEQPRDILKAIGGIQTLELAQSRSSGFCCGGGGGHLWMEEEPDKRVNVKRTEQVIETKADVVASACPYCLSMFEDGLKTKGADETIQAKDLSELVLEALIYKADGQG